LKINNGFDFCTDIHITNYFLYNNMKQASKGYSGKLASAESSQLRFPACWKARGSHHSSITILLRGEF